MSPRVGYEWCVAEVDEHGDRDDLHFADTLAGLRLDDYESKKFSVELVRTVSDGIGGVLDRCWADLEDEKLPDHFSYNPEQGPRVPKRFHAEVSRFYEKMRA